MSMTAKHGGAQADDAEIEDAYRAAVAGLEHCLALGAISLEAGNPRRATQHLLGALSDLAPELRALAAALPR